MQNYQEIAQYINQIRTLCNNRVLDKNEFTKILSELLPFLPEIKKNDFLHSDFFDYYQRKQEIMLLEKYESIQTKIYYWREYIFWEIWKKLRSDNIGHCSDFQIYNNYFFVKINLNLDVNKRQDESKEEYQQRKKLFYETTKYQYKNSNSSRKYIIDNDFNKQMLLDYLKGFISFDRYSFITRNNCLTEIIIYAKDFNIKEDTDKKEDSFNIAKLEDINKEAQTTLDALYYLEHDVVKDIDLTNSLISSFFCYVSRIVNFNNEYLQNYDKIILSNREKNLMLQEKGKELGKTYDTSIMMKTMSDFKAILEKYLRNKYCLSLDEFSFNGQYHITVSFNFSRCKLEAEFANDDTFEQRNFVFDKYCIKKDLDTEEYYISTDAITNIKDMLKKEFEAQKISINISEKNELLFIDNISFVYDDFVIPPTN